MNISAKIPNLMLGK
jgi:hypothetical protein